MSKYKRNRVKDLLIISVWVLALIPIIPAVIILSLQKGAERVADWYDGKVLSLIRCWRNRWNPEKG